MKQRIFSKNAQAEWENVKRDAQRHLLMGVTQFEYLSDLDTQLTGEAIQVVDNCLDKRDFKNSENPNVIPESIVRLYHDYSVLISKSA